MAKQKQFEKVLDYLVAAEGQPVMKDILLKDLGGQIVENRIATYMWEIETKAGVKIAKVKDGRKVVGYQIAATAPAPDVSVEDAEAAVDSGSQSGG